MPRKLTLKAVEAQIRKLEAQAKKLKEAEKPGMAELKAVIAKFKLAPADIKTAMKAPRSKGARRGMAIHSSARQIAVIAPAPAGRAAKQRRSRLANNRHCRHRRGSVGSLHCCSTTCPD